MIDKMSAAHGRIVSAGHKDIVRTQADSMGPKGVGMGNAVQGASGNLAGAIDHMVKQGMPIDMQHILSIREAIADGRYPVDPMMVADKMIEFEQPGGDFS